MPGSPVSETGSPAKRTVERWRDLTPEGFLFAAKAPQAITHERFLEGCQREVAEFLDTMALLGDRLGPILFQFPYYTRKSGVEFSEFLRRLGAFLPMLPCGEGFRFSVEVRNKTWLRPALFETLAAHGVALALIDYPWMHPPADLFAIPGIVTADLTYLRWLGDRYEIEKMTQVWDRTVIDRTTRLNDWAPPVADLLTRGVSVYGYFNNHYSGYAPADVELFKMLMGKTG